MCMHTGPIWTKSKGGSIEGVAHPFKSCIIALLFPLNPVFCETGDIRLVGGQTNLEGRVEICVNETWGTVCDQMWNDLDANVACRQLGFQPADATPIYDAGFGAGAGRIWLNNLICVGTESRLIDCSRPTFGDSDGCNGHNDDAGVRCEEGETKGSITDTQTYL